MKNRCRPFPVAIAGAFVLTLVLLGLLGSGPSPVTLAHSKTSIIRVVPTGSDTPGCGSEATPCRTIQHAVDQSQPGSEVRIAAGTYTGVQNAPSLNTSIFTATQVVVITKSITVRGGYSTVDWDTSDPEINHTILDAQGQGRVIYITGDISPTVEGLRITGGDATGLGGMQVGPWIDDCGGGLHVTAAAGLISGNWVYDNSARKGGGLYLSGSDASVVANTIESNTGQYGAGMYVRWGNPILERNRVSTNTGAVDGGGLNMQASAALLKGNIVVSNVAGFGGGAFLVGGAPKMTANTFLSNTGLGSGGGLWLHNSPATLVNNVVARNQTNGRGSGLYIRFSSPTLLHTTIADNSGGDGAGLHITDFAYGGPSNVNLLNTILVGHTVGITVADGNLANLDGVLWYANSEANVGGAGTVFVATDVTGDPVFVDPVRGDYHVRPPSAAIDAGVDAGVYIDIDGDTRPQGDGFDLGADEFVPPATLAINYACGKPGSFFTVTGSRFPPNETASVIVNTKTLTNSLEVDGTGNVSFMLDTRQAGPGRYWVRVTSNPSAMVSFTLDPTSPLRPQEDAGPVLEVPSGIEFASCVYLPLVQR